MEIQDIDKINIERLIQGYQYSYLPENLLLGNIEKNINDVVLNLLKQTEQYCYRFN